MSNPTCSIPGCGKKTFAKGWCSAHYQNNRRFGSPTANSKTAKKKPAPKKEKKVTKPKADAPPRPDETRKRWVIDRNELYTRADIAKLFKMGPRQVGDALIDLPARGEYKGNLTYDLSEAAQVIYGLRLEDGENEDPLAGLKPTDRKAAIESKLLMIKLKAEQRKFIHVDEVHENLAEIFKQIDLGLSTLPDNIEREASLDAEQFKVMDRVIGKLRRLLVDNIG